MISPPRWSEQQLESDRLRAIEVFRKERGREGLEAYLNAFDRYQEVVGKLLASSSALTEIDTSAIEILTDRRLLEAFRYLTGPPLSSDDLRTLSDSVLTPARLKGDPAMVRRILDVVRIGMDRRRFPWVEEGRQPEEAEKAAAILASASLMAASRVSAIRRNEGKDAQEEHVEQPLLAAGMRKQVPRPIQTLRDAPGYGAFCRECLLGNRKADIVIGLFDGRTLAVECKVSNSAINSVKRLNNDAAAKAEYWTTEFGERQIIPAAVLSGVFKVHNLKGAQERNLTIFWAHALDELTNWIERTKQGGAIR